MSYALALLLGVSGLFIPMESEIPVSRSQAALVSTTGAPDVAISDSGYVVSVWETEPPSGFNQNLVRFSLVDADGTLIKEEIVFGSGTPDVLYHNPAVDMATDGRFIVVAEVEDDTAGDTDIIGRPYAADGTPESSAFTVNSTSVVRNQYRPDVAMFPNGDFYVVWVEEFSASDTDIYHAIWFNSSTNPFAQYLAPTSLLSSPDLEDYPRIALDPGTLPIDSQEPSVVVGYSRPNPNNAIQEYVAQRLTNTGNTVGSAVAFSATDPTSMMFPGDVAMDDANGYVTVWLEGGEIFRRRFDKNGVAQNPSDLTAGPGFGTFHEGIRVGIDKLGDYLVGFDYFATVYGSEYNADDSTREVLLRPNCVRDLTMTSAAVDVSRNGVYAVIAWKTRFVYDYFVFNRRFQRVDPATDSDGDGIADSYEVLNDSDPNDPNSRPKVLDLNQDGRINTTDAITWYRHLIGGSPRTIPGAP